MKGKQSKMPNDSKGYGPKSSSGSNHGKSGGLHQAPANGGNGTMAPVSNKNPYPNGLA